MDTTDEITAFDLDQADRRLIERSLRMTLDAIATHGDEPGMESAHVAALVAYFRTGLRPPPPTGQNIGENPTRSTPIGARVRYIGGNRNKAGATGTIVLPTKFTHPSFCRVQWDNGPTVREAFSALRIIA
jgi:hypothetical protein